MCSRAAVSVLGVCAVLVFPPALLFGQSPGASSGIAAWPGDASTLLTSVRAVRIQVTQSYVDGEDTLTGITVPAASVAARIFGYAGIKNVSASTSGEALAVSISLTGEGESANYIPGGTMSTGASVSGTITLGTGETACQAKFAGEEPPPAVVTLGSEDLLPFRTAFDKSDYPCILLGLLGKAFGGAPLTKALADAAAPVRRGAVSEIAWMGDPKAAPALVPVLKDKDASVRTAAAAALGKLGLDTSVSPLLAALKSPTNAPWPGVRVAVIRALSDLGSSTATPALVTAMTDPDADVRKAAAAALPSLGWQAATDQDLIALTVAQGDLAGAAAFGSAAIPRLKAVMNDADPETQDAAINALAGMKDPTGLDVVIALAKDRGQDTFRGRDSAIIALGKSREVRAADALLFLLKDPEYSIVYQAATNLAQNGEQRAVAPLLAVLKGKDDSVKDVAASALGKLGWKPATDKEALLFYPAVQGWDECVKLGDKAIPALLDAARSGAYWDDALETVGRIRSPASVTALVKMLKDDRPELRAAAASALGNAKAVSARDALKRAVKDENEMVKEAASEALAALQEGGSGD
jgi:HEAT repeat protein